MTQLMRLLNASLAFAKRKFRCTQPSSIWFGGHKRLWTQRSSTYQGTTKNHAVG